MLCSSCNISGLFGQQDTNLIEKNFDLNGVLTDTAKYHYFAWKKIVDELGIVFTLKEEDTFREQEGFLMPY